MSPTSPVVLDSDGKLRLFESGLWFGPFRQESVFRLEEHSKQKGFFRENSIPKMAEFAWSDLARQRPKVWIVEAKSSIARQENTAKFDANLQEWASKLSNAIAMIAGVKVGAFRPEADLSDVPAYILDSALRDLQFYLIVVLNAEWATDTECKKIQIDLRKKLADPVRAWGMHRDSVYVYNPEMAQAKGLTSGELDL
jgi:hypothetical protein